MSFWGNGDTTEPQPEFSLRCFHIFVSTRCAGAHKNSAGA